MNFQNISLKDQYRSLLDNVVKDFYIPLLNNAISINVQLVFSHPPL